ncbi:Alpha-L-fucosidase; AltName: Full=Alpha-L-fucoside fucohydrolase; Flags: Precursor [Serendipita indica DSM 11827]|nr:Alpha-L-fucosidase; AltName: Full=Alpha-L-fucoside fucohydrolase; Flags: Precursor [Serendipita indica DSM 11827]
MLIAEWAFLHRAVLWVSNALELFSSGTPELASHSYFSVPVTIDHLFDNVATHDFDGKGNYFPIELLPTGQFTSENVNFTLPRWGHGRKDNVVAEQQVVHVDFGHVREFHILYAGDWIDGETGNRFEFNFKDWSKQSVECSVKNWWNLHWLNSGPIQLPYHHTRDKINHNITQIHHWSTQINSLSPLTSIRFPSSSYWNRLHIFAISLVPAYAPSHVLPEFDTTNWPSRKQILPALGVKGIRATTRWVEKEGHGPKEPIVEVTLSNLRANVNDAKHLQGYLNGDYTVHLVGDGIHTTAPGHVRRLMPGDDGKVVFRGEEWPLTIDGDAYEPTKASLSRHETPRWWRNAKFGIFIHWGVYSVPGWVPTGYYEEWYHWWIHNPAQSSNILWNYHRKTYGEEIVYDDFIPQFDGSKFNASQWINLFASAGAKYFVLVTKHHDGFALFDTANSTHRSSVHLGPKRDFIGELMTAAKKEHPSLKRGTYYSMPEWFNPAYKKYGFGNWPGGLARNAYNSSKFEPYTGHLEGKDYLRDIQEAHMKILAEKYETDIMWCDIGGPNRTAEFAAEWYNQAAKQNRQVTMNNRCGIAPDFDTPEYARFSSIQTRTWETNEGIDPFSYGYNRQTKDEEYRSTRNIIHSLVDIVSKNGNYLLNLGPTGTGEIIPAMVQRLHEVGHWLSHSGSCVYNTTYSFPGAEERGLRFTTTPDSFCIIALERPEIALEDHEDEHHRLLLNNLDHMQADRASMAWELEDAQAWAKPKGEFALLVVERPVPIMPKDKVFLLGGNGKALYWRLRAGRLGILVPVEELNKVDHAWAFQIQYAT